MVEIIDLTTSEDPPATDKMPASKTVRVAKEEKPSPVVKKKSSPAEKKVKIDPVEKTSIQPQPKKSATKTASSPQSTNKGPPPLKPTSVDETDHTNFSSLLTPSMVTFHLGPKKKAYHIHRSLICSASPIFSSHFGSLEDTKSPVSDMYLPDQDPRVFELLIAFLYRGGFPEIVPPAAPTTTTEGVVFMPVVCSSTSATVNGASTSITNNNTTTAAATANTAPSPTTTPPAGKDPNQPLHTANLSLLLSLHFLSHSWSLPSLQNHTLDHIIRYLKKSNSLLQITHLASIYKNLPSSPDQPAQPLRRLAADHFVWSVMKKSVPSATRRECLKKAATAVKDMEFLWDVMDSVVGGRKYHVPIEPGMGEKGRCAYHVHEKRGERCE